MAFSGLRPSERHSNAEGKWQRGSLLSKVKAVAPLPRKNILFVTLKAQLIVHLQVFRIVKSSVLENACKLRMQTSRFEGVGGFNKSDMVLTLLWQQHLNFTMQVTFFGTFFFKTLIDPYRNI